MQMGIRVLVKLCGGAACRRALVRPPFFALGPSPSSACCKDSPLRDKNIEASPSSPTPLAGQPRVGSFLIVQPAQRAWANWDFLLSGFLSRGICSICLYC